ncbi:MAG: HAD-IIB family hydrolase [Gemmatimonadales bacterium]
MRPSLPTTASLAVITDLDGCLLDARDYGFDPARAVLRRLRRWGVPLVLCTSKTRAELRVLFAALGSAHLAVIEDGGGILVPPGFARHTSLPGARRTRDGRLLGLSASYRVVRRAFRRLAHVTHGAVRGFGDMPAAELARMSGLTLHAARLAKRREFDEPFLFLRDGRRQAPRAHRFATRLGLAVTHGGRFFHLHGQTDKGWAIRLVRRLLLEPAHGTLTVIALGDSALDAPMLREADHAIIVPTPSGRPDPSLRRLVPGASIAPAPGPAGWARVVAGTLRRYGVA